MQKRQTLERGQSPRPRTKGRRVRECTRSLAGRSATEQHMARRIREGLMTGAAAALTVQLQWAPGKRHAMAGVGQANPKQLRPLRQSWPAENLPVRPDLQIAIAAPALHDSSRSDPQEVIACHARDEMR
jgi:hypothetical protein